MVKISNASNENEIHRVEMRIPKIYFFAREAQILEERWPENLEKMAKHRETYCYAN